MLTIEVKYRPVNWLPFSGKAESKVPQNWGELNQKQLIAVASLFNSAISDINFLQSMSGLKKSILHKLSDYERHKLMEIFEFVGDQKPYHEFIIRKLSVSHCPMLLAPCPKLKGVTFGQFIFADTYFGNYQQSQNETDLNKFIASLYLCMNEKFEERLIQERFLCIGKLDLNIRQSVALNFQLIHEWLALAYPLIFQKLASAASRSASDTSLEAPVAEPVKARDPNQWIKVFQNFVGDDILHDDVWASKPVNTIFAYMTRKYKENARRN
jgi:hypothetical protein